MSRLEGFSDTAFGFAITLLVVSLAVPNHFDELIQQLRGLPVFAVTFALVSVIWYAQFVFFRRYALSDPLTVVLTLLLLFVVLFYVYPLKFLFGVVFAVGGATLQQSDAPLLFLIYGLGFAGVNLTLALLYLHAYQKRGDLKLNEYERYVTRLSIVDNLATASIGLVSAGLAQVVPAPYSGSIPGFVYFAVAVPRFVSGMLGGRRARELAHRSSEPAKTVP
ncbi:MAG: TMEM175 family protein [Candidatus Dormibacteraeota bacterium]|nr:TMEM175 family protein [Candidatus Dormibacteraeota bacterium]